MVSSGHRHLAASQFSFRLDAAPEAELPRLTAPDRITWIAPSGGALARN